MKIHIPNYTPSTYPCVVVQNATTVRAYKQAPYNPAYGNTIQIQYRDFYYTSNYTFTDNTQSFSYNSALPTCLSAADLTNDVYHRNDFDSVLIIFLIMSIFCFYLPLKVMVRLFKRFR